MSTFRIHTIDSAPEHSQPALRELQQTFGFIPNVAGAMAGSPVLIGAFLDLFKSVHRGTFSEAEIQTLLLTNAVTNRCEWAVALHTALALKEGLTPTDVEAIRTGDKPADARLAALSAFAKRAIDSRGHLNDHDVDAFLSAGFRRDQLLELLAATAASTLTNYVANLAQPPLETQFAAHVWRERVC